VVTVISGDEYCHTMYVPQRQSSLHNHGQLFCAGHHVTLPVCLTGGIGSPTRTRYSSEHQCNNSSITINDRDRTRTEINLCSTIGVRDRAPFWPATRIRRLSCHSLLI
jgi:hypothetical protein